jgi:tellurite resistance protein TerA
MRRLLLFLSLPVLANCYPCNQAHAQPYGSPPGYYAPAPPPPGYYPPSPPPGYYPASPPPYGYVGGPGQRPVAPAYSPENCGTPDEPKPCPPMPRVPLPYYPANR